MGNSLKDQLVRSGLVSKHKANTAGRKKHARAKAGGDKAVSESERLAIEAQAAKAERDRKLNRERDALAQEKAVAAQVRQLITMNAVPRDDGEVPYHFTDGTTVKTIHVTNKLTRQIANGQLAIVRLDERYEVVPSAVADKIAQRDAACVIAQESRSHDEELDDEYADFKVPDDLMW